MYYIYIVCCSDDTLYTGSTTDINKRIAAHNSGKGAKYTRGRLPVQLVYQEQLADKGAALSREREIKKMSRQQKLQMIANLNNNT